MKKNRSTKGVRILAVERMLKQASDEGLSVKEILSKLQLRYGIETDRRQIYGDLYELNLFYNIQIIHYGWNYKYVLSELR
jgi:hypothetical protein